ncbi:PRTRC system protein C [Spirosoma lituiforme]
MLLATQLKRVFLMEEKGQTVELSDPDPTLSPQAVLNHYSNLYAILTTAKISPADIRDDTVQYRFESVMGTKG